MTEHVYYAKYYEKGCAWCGSWFAPKTTKGKFCSNRCRCAWNAAKRRIEKRIRRAVQDALWLCDLEADNPEDELVRKAYAQLWVGVSLHEEMMRRNE
jgi:hypothetical protein